MKYFRVLPDMEIVDRWHLGRIDGDKDNWQFTSGNAVDVGSTELSLEVRYSGTPLDFTITRPFGVPIISQKLGDKLNLFGADVQLIPIQKIGMAVQIRYYIWVAKQKVDCVDESKSIFRKYTPYDPVRPDKAGSYESFDRLVLDEQRIGGRHIFRILGYEIFLVVDEIVKKAIETVAPIGIQFQEIGD